MNKIVTFGELMLRLKSIGKERFLQTPFLEASFGGSEANVAVSLANFGKKVSFVSAFPDNYFGKQAEMSLKKFGVEVESVLKSGRLGLYFLEDGACQRPSQVIYDRENSVFSLSEKSDYNWNKFFENASWFHFSGVTPAVSENAFLSVEYAVDSARKKGITVSIDLNYRKKHWNYGKSCTEVMKSLVSKIDVLIANEEDIQKCLGFSLPDASSNAEKYKILCKNVKKTYPNLKYIAVTMRESYSADKNFWSAFLFDGSNFFESFTSKIENIVERLGSGDSFAAGLIYGLTEFNDLQKALNFATASGCLKHSVPGDFNLVSKEEVETLVNGNSSGRIQR